MFRFAQHDKWNLWRCGFNRTQTRIAYQVRLKLHLHFPLPCGGGKGVGHCERAQRASAATNRQGILMILALHTVDCFALLAMTKNSACKNIHCHVERSETSLSDSKLLWIPSSFHLYLRFYALLFSSRGTGGLIAKQPPIPL